MRNVTVKLIGTLATIRVLQFPISVVAVCLYIASTAKLRLYGQKDPFLFREAMEPNTSLSKHTRIVHLQSVSILGLIAATISLLAAACIGGLHLDPR